MQAEELIIANNKANEANERYKELYDFAPSGYFTLSREGNIMKLNLHAALMLGKESFLLLNSRFAFFVKNDSRIDFHNFLEDIFLGKNDISCELPLISNDNKNLYVQLTGSLSEYDDQINIIANDITERKLMEISLRDKEERLRLALLATNDVVWDWDIVNDSQQWNEAGERVFGWSEIVKNPVNAAWWMERVHPDDKQRIHVAFNSALQNKSIMYWEDEYRFRKSDGSYAEVYDRANLLRDNNGKALRMIGAMQDISEKKNAEKLIMENEFKFRTLADFTHDMEYWLLPDGKINYMSSACQRITGYSIQEFKNDPELLTRIIHPDDIDIFNNHHKVPSDIESVNPNKDIYFRIINKYSQTVWIEHVCRAIYDENKNYLGRRVSHRDITERMKAEEEMSYALVRFSSFANASQYGMGMADLDGNIIFANKTLTTLLGENKSEDCIGKHFPSAYYSESIKKKLQEEVMPALMKLGQ